MSTSLPTSTDTSAFSPADQSAIADNISSFEPYTTPLGWSDSDTIAVSTSTDTDGLSKLQRAILRMILDILKQLLGF